MEQIRKTRTRNLMIFFAASMVYSLSQMFFSIILMKEDLWRNFHIQFVAHYTVIFTMCILDYKLLIVLNKYLPYAKNVFYRIIADVIGLVAISAVLLWCFNFIIYNVFDIPGKGMPSFLIKFAFAMAANIPILLVFELIYYYQSEQIAVAESEKAKRKILLFQHETLRSQINPHFLFNSLNVLSSLIYINQDNANKFTKALSKSYRYVLSLTRHPVVSVTEELDALDSYIFMMNMRFENTFTLVIENVAGIKSKKIIPLSLQLLIENAFKHNIASEENKLNLKIRGLEDYISIENNVQPSQDVAKGGIGLKYLISQYSLYSQQLVIERTQEMFTVKIPYIHL